MHSCTLNQTVSFKPKKQKSQKFSVTPKLFPGWRFSEAQFLHLQVCVFMSFLCYSVHHVISRLLIGQHFYMARVILPSVACACPSQCFWFGRWSFSEEKWKNPVWKNTCAHVDVASLTPDTLNFTHRWSFLYVAHSRRCVLTRFDLRLPAA